MKKFEFSNADKTEIRHCIAPEFLIDVVRLDAPNDYSGAGLGFDDIFDEISIRGWHFCFVMQDGEEVFDDDEIMLCRSICRRAAKWYKAKVVMGEIPLERYVSRKGIAEDEIFKLQKSDGNLWIVAHKPSGFIVEFEEGNFNDSQRVIDLEEGEIDIMQVVRIMRGIGDWLVKNHREIL